MKGREISKVGGGKSGREKEGKEELLN